MKTTTVNLLPTTSYGTPSGNYDGSSLDFSGDPEKAADYYGGFGGLQTIAFYFNDFQGTIHIEATLESEPTDAAEQWFLVSESQHNDSSITENFSRNITGNFTWIRARVTDFTQGTITKITMSY